MTPGMQEAWNGILAAMTIIRILIPITDHTTRGILISTSRSHSLSSIRTTDIMIDILITGITTGVIRIIIFVTKDGTDKKHKKGHV